MQSTVADMYNWAKAEATNVANRLLAEANEAPVERHDVSFDVYSVRCPLPLSPPSFLLPHSVYCMLVGNSPAHRRRILYSSPCRR